MKKQSILITLAAAALIMISGMVGCSSETEGQSESFVNKVIDTLTTTVSAEFANAVIEHNDNKQVKELSEEVNIEPADNVPHFSDFIINGNMIYAVTNNSFVTYDMKAKTEHRYPVEGILNAVVFHDGSVYAGGKSLYKLNDTSLEFVDSEFDGEITTMYSYGYQLMIGTEDGLYSRSIFSKDKIMDDMTISAITADQSGLWVGTLGEGLYRWDGEDYKKRYLNRDTCLFDFVNTVDFQHNHLYLGCDNGFYIYDGGSWKTLTTEDGLPDDNIRTIDASDWVVYVGSDKGVVSYFNDEISPVNKLEDTQVNVLKVKGRKLLAATEYDGIIVKRGNDVKTLIPSIAVEKMNLLSLIP